MKKRYQFRKPFTVKAQQLILSEELPELVREIDGEYILQRAGGHHYRIKPGEWVVYEGSESAYVFTDKHFHEVYELAE